MSRAEADATLAALRSDLDRTSSTLLDLENHPGYQVLRNYPQTGTTATTWTRLQETIAGLWADFETYRSTVGSARAIRDRRSRLDPADLAELSELLRGDAPISGSGLGSAGPRVGLDELTERLRRSHAEVVGTLDRVDRVAGAVRTGLEPLQTRLAADRARAGLTAADTGPDARTAQALARQLVALTEQSVSDPLSLTDPQARVAALAEQAARWHARAIELERLHADWPQAVAGLRERAAQLAEITAAARAARDTVAATIRSAPLPPPSDRIAGVNALVNAVSTADAATSAQQSDWSARVAAFDVAGRAVTEALAVATADAALATGLLNRRVELRGRLTAYRSKATRLGRADEPALAAAYRAAADALATGPCDLAACTRLVAAYSEHLGRIR